MKDYAKMILYAYPLLATVEEDYEEHVKIKAVRSYGCRRSAEKIAEELAEEILEMRRLEWLKGKVSEALARLSEEERVLVAARYFGKTKGLKAWLVALDERGGRRWTERTYFRRQARLGEKIGGLLRLAGVTEEVFEREYADMPTFRKILRYVREGKDTPSAGERKALEK